MSNTTSGNSTTASTSSRLNGDQVLALSYDDLSDPEYLNKVHGDLCRAPDEESFDRWAGATFLPEDVLNFGHNPELGLDLLHRQAQRGQSRFDAASDSISKQGAVYWRIAELVRSFDQSETGTGLRASPTSTHKDYSCLLTRCIEGIILIVQDAARRSISARRLASTLTSAIEALPLHSEIRFGQTLTVALCRIFETNFPLSQTSGTYTSRCSSLPLAAVCCLSLARWCLRVKDSVSLLIVLTQLLSMRSMVLALIEELDRSTFGPQPLALKADEEVGTDVGRLKKKILSEAKLIGKATAVPDIHSPAANRGAYREERHDEEWRKDSATKHPSRDRDGKEAVVRGSHRSAQQTQSKVAASKFVKQVGPAKSVVDRDVPLKVYPAAVPRDVHQARSHLAHALKLCSTVPQDLTSADSDGLRPAGTVEMQISSCTEVHTCGQNSYGELGHCDAEQRRAFSAVDFLRSKAVKSIGAGNEHSIFVTLGGGVVVAGYNDNGQCGVGSTAQVRTPAPLEALAGERIVGVAAANGCEHSLLITHDGRVFAFGYNYRGQLGLGHTTSEATPKLVTALSGERVQSAACSYHHSMCLTTEGSLFSFGRNDAGQLGLGDTLDRRLPTQVQDAPNGLAMVSCGQFHSALVTRTGDLWMCGKNEYGQLGIEGVEAVRVLTLVTRPALDPHIVIVKACCGYYHTLALTSSGRVYAMGRNDYGQLGLGHNQPRVHVPTEIIGLRDRNVVDVATGCYHSCAVTFNGMIYVFGRNNHGQLGSGDMDERHQPHPVDTFLGRRIMSVACGFYHTIVLSSTPEAFSSTSSRIIQGQQQQQGSDESTSCRASVADPRADLVLHVIDRMDAPGLHSGGNTGSEVLLRYQLRATSRLLQAAFRHVASPPPGESVLHLISKKDLLALLVKTLRAAKTLFDVNAGLISSSSSSSAVVNEQISFEQTSTLDTDYGLFNVYSSSCETKADPLASESWDISLGVGSLRSTLLHIFNFVYSDLESVGEVVDAAGQCISAHLELLFPTPESRGLLLSGLVSYLAYSFNDDLMLANTNKCAHVCRCVTLYTKLLKRLESHRAIHALCVRDPGAALGEFVSLLRGSTEVFRAAKCTRILRHFTATQLADTKSALCLLEHYCANFVKILGPLIFDETGSLSAASGDADLVGVIFSLADTCLDILTPREGVSVDSGISVHRAGPIFPSVVPSLLLFGLSATPSSPLLFALVCCADRLVRRLRECLGNQLHSDSDGREGPFSWADKLLKTCISFCARSCASVVNQSVRSSASLSSPSLATLRLWAYLELPELMPQHPLFDSAEIPFALLNITQVLSAKHASRDFTYAFVIQSSRAHLPTLQRIEAFVLKTLLTANSLSGAGDAVVDWSLVAAVTKALFARRSSILVSWERALSAMLVVATSVSHLLDACSFRGVTPSPYKFSRMVSAKLRRVLSCVLCAVRWRRLLGHRRGVLARAVAKLFIQAGAAALDGLLSDKQLDAERVWADMSSPLNAEVVLGWRRVKALAVLSSYLGDSGSQHNTHYVLESLNSIAARGASYCSTGTLRRNLARETAQLFNDSLLQVAIEAASRLSDRGLMQAGELKTLRLALNALLLHFAEVKMESAIFRMFFEKIQKLFITLVDTSEGGAKSTHSRIQTRDNLKALRCVGDLISQLVLRCVLSLHTSLHGSFRLLCNATVRLLLHLHAGFFVHGKASDSKGSASSEDTAGLKLSEDTRVLKKRCQEIISKPQQFCRNREGLVVQGDRLYTNFKGIDFTLSFWVFLSKKPTDRYSFLAGKISHTDAWPALMLRSSDMHLEVVFGKGNEFERFASKASLPLNAWVHVCVVAEPRKIKLYIGGILDGSANTSGNTRATLYPLIVGSCPVGVRTRVEHVREGFDGLLGSFNYHTRALSPAYVKYVTDQGAPEAADPRDLYGYRVLTALSQLVQRFHRALTAADQTTMPELSLRLFFCSTGRVQSLAASTLQQLLVKCGTLQDIALDSCKDDKFSLLGIDVGSSSTSSVMKISSLPDCQSFQERLALYLLRIIGCCWEPSVLSSFSTEPRLAAGASASSSWSEYLVDKQLSDFIAFAPGFIANAVLCSVLSVHNRNKVDEAGSSSVAEFGFAVQSILLGLYDDDTWNAVISKVVGSVLERTSGVLVGGGSWAGASLRLVEALGASAVLGFRLPPVLVLGGEVFSAHSDGQGRLVGLSPSTGQATLLSDDHGTYRLLTHRVSEVLITRSVAECRINDAGIIASAFKLMSELLPYAAPIVSDLLCTGRLDHAFVRQIVGRARIVELLLFKHLSAFLSSLPSTAYQPGAFTAELGSIHDLAFRTMRSYASESEQPTDQDLLRLWIRCSTYSNTATGSPVHQNALPAGVDKNVAEYASKSLLIYTDNFRADRQMQLLRTGAFIELIGEMSGLADNHSESSNKDPGTSMLCGCPCELSDGEYSDLLSFVTTTRHLILQSCRRILAATAAATELVTSRRVMTCQVLALSPELDEGSTSLVRSLFESTGDFGSSASACLRYTSMSFLRSTAPRGAEAQGLLENSDLFSRQAAAIKAWMSFQTGKDTELAECTILLQSLFPALPFARGSLIELDLLRLCSLIVDSALRRVFEDTHIPPELVALVKGGAFVQLRRRTQDYLLAERGRIQVQPSDVARCLVDIEVGLELIQRKSTAASSSIEDFGDATQTSPPKLLGLTTTAVELDLSPCCSHSNDTGLEVAVGVIATGEETVFETVFIGCAGKLTEAGLSPNCSYAVRCRLLPLNWSTAVEFTTQSGTPFTFCSHRCGPDIALSNDGLVATYTGDDSWSTVLGSQPFSCGVASWEMRIVQSSTAYIFVGVAKSHSDLNTFLGGDENGWGFIGEQALYHSREKVQVYGESFAKGDVVGVCLDLTAGTLSFSRNGKTLGVGFSNVFGELYPAVAFYNAGQEVQLLSEGFRCSCPHEPVSISPSRVVLEDVCIIRELWHCFASKTLISSHLSEKLAAFCTQWGAGTQSRRRAVSGRYVMLSKQSELLDGYRLQHGDRVRTPIGLATVAGSAAGRLWLQVSDSGEVWFFSRQQVLEGKESGLFNRASYLYGDKPSSQSDPTYSYDAQSVQDLTDASMWSEALDRELMVFMAALAESMSVSVWDVSPDDIHREFRLVQQPLIRICIQNTRLSSFWGIKGPSRRAAVARCGLLRFLNHYMQNFALFQTGSAASKALKSPFSTEDSMPLVTKLLSTNTSAALPRMYDEAAVNSHVSIHFAWKGNRYLTDSESMRYRTFLELKQAYVNEQLIKTGSRPAKTEDEYDYPEDLPQVKLNRFRSFRAAESGAEGDELMFASMFCQLWRELRAQAAPKFKISYSHPMDDGQARAFKVRFEGEGVDDYGGPYRDVFQCICEELQRLLPSRDNVEAGCSIPLLCPTRNWGVECHERCKYVFNPALRSAVHIDLFHFLGQLVGIAMRSKITLDLALPSLVWKSVVGEGLVDADLQSVDFQFSCFLSSLMDIHAKLLSSGGEEERLQTESDAASMLQDLTWTTISTNGDTMLLVPGGDERVVKVHEIEDFVMATVKARLGESYTATSAFRSGLLEVVGDSIQLLAWDELESLVCGSKKVDVKRLQDNTEYDDDVSMSDLHIQYFWSVLEEMSEAERGAYLRFVWARPTLPPKGVPFPQKMRVQSVCEEAPGGADSFLPKAHTCFFSINLPRYSSKKVMAERLRYAIENCTEMDADYKLTDGEDVAGWQVTH